MTSVTRYIEEGVADKLKRTRKSKPRWKPMIMWKSVYRAVYTSWPSVRSCPGYWHKLGFRPWVHDVTVYRIPAFGLVRRCYILKRWGSRRLWYTKQCIASKLTENVWTQRSSAHPGSGCSVTVNNLIIAHSEINASYLINAPLTLLS